MTNQIVLLTGGERGAGPTACLPHHLPSTQNVASTHSQQPSGRGRRWKEKPTRKPVTDITQTHTFGGGNFKKHKTNHNVFFIPARSWRHKCYCMAGIPASHSIISTLSTIFPKMTSLCSASSNCHFQLLLPCVDGSTGKQRICSALIFGRKTFK